MADEPFKNGDILDVGGMIAFYLEDEIYWLTGNSGEHHYKDSMRPCSVHGVVPLCDCKKVGSLNRTFFEIEKLVQERFHYTDYHD